MEELGSKQDEAEQERGKSHRLRFKELMRDNRPDAFKVRTQEGTVPESRGSGALHSPGEREGARGHLGAKERNICRVCIINMMLVYVSSSVRIT